jgi:hypothetical protein
MHFLCNAYEFEANCHATALAIRKLLISCNIHMKQLLRSNAEGYS